MKGIDDAALLERARRGDEDAFSELFSRHQGAVFRYAVYMCGADAADDVVQDTFMNVLLKSGRYDASKGAVISYILWERRDTSCSGDSPAQVRFLSGSLLRT